MAAKHGDRVRDVVTGLEGIVIGITTWITGCDQVCVQPGAIKDGEVCKGSWFDISRLEVIEAGAVKLVNPVPNRDIGGPHPGY